VLGAAHALAPGHGKTIAGAYLVGTRAHWHHAIYLALTVTITHTAAVYALGFATLGASRYVTPAQLLPVLSLISGAIVLGVGLGLLARRVRAALGEHAHHHDHTHDHEHHHHHHDHGHSHLPASADGSSPGWRGWLAFGISGGLVPCPSALVVMLSAIALDRIVYGLVLVTVFSLGLAATLCAVGVLFVYAGRGLRDRRIPALWARLVPVASALVITGVGLVLCWEALAGVKSLTGPY
jgi:ABC-type nickel/cobalt efflux system permease component RcnA